MIKRLSMAAVMCAGIFARGRGTAKLGALDRNSTPDGLCPLPFQIELL
jgi:hypothetical protein